MRDHFQCVGLYWNVAAGGTFGRPGQRSDEAGGTFGEARFFNIINFVISEIPGRLRMPDTPACSEFDGEHDGLALHVSTSAAENGLFHNGALHY